MVERVISGTQVIRSTGISGSSTSSSSGGGGGGCSSRQTPAYPCVSQSRALASVSMILCDPQQGSHTNTHTHGLQLYIIMYLPCGQRERERVKPRKKVDVYKRVQYKQL